MARVLIVDDHAMVRVGLRSMLDSAEDLDVVGEAEDGQAAQQLVADVAPDIVLMDLSMPVLDGIAATRAVLARNPQVRVLVLTSFGDHAKVREALAAGAIGYVLKDCAPADLLAAVRAAVRGEVPLDPRVAGALLPSATPQPSAAGMAAALSQREREVLGLLASGLANKQIARSLGIAERTVKSHVGSIFRTIGVVDRTSAALWARDHLDDAS